MLKRLRQVHQIEIGTGRSRFKDGHVFFFRKASKTRESVSKVSGDDISLSPRSMEAFYTSNDAPWQDELYGERTA